MKTLSVGQLKALSEFFNTIAAGWFSGGIIAPLFSQVSSLEKLAFFVVGATLSYWFLKLSLAVVEDVKQ